MTMQKYCSIIPITVLAVALLASSCSRQTTVQPVQQAIVDAVFASGHIVTDDEYIVTANADGYLAQAFVKEGDVVQPNMPLFALANQVQTQQLVNAQANYDDALLKARPNSPQLAQLNLQVQQAALQRQTDEANYNRYARLVKTNAVSQADYERARLQFEAAKSNEFQLQKQIEELQATLALGVKNTQTQLAIQQENSGDYLLASSITGQVLTVLKQPGELVRRGEAVARVGGGQALAKLFVAEEDINRIAIGQRVVIALNTEKEVRHEALVSKIYPAFDVAEQSFIIEARFVTPPDRLFASTQLQANIIIANKQQALLLPAACLTGQNTVLLANNTTTSIVTGIVTNEWVEVLDGLGPEQHVLVPNKP